MPRNNSSHFYKISPRGIIKRRKTKSFIFSSSIFQPPVPPESWGDSIRDAIEIPPACPQPTEGVAYIEYHVPGFNRTSEDCLFLNVYLPKVGRFIFTCATDFTQMNHFRAIATLVNNEDQFIARRCH